MTTTRAIRRVSRAAAVAAAAVLVAASVAPASAATSDPDAKKSDTARQDAKPVDKSQRYCVIQRATGSIRTYRTCKTREQWIADEGFDPLAKPH